jgi:hypothetical protein
MSTLSSKQNSNFGLHSYFCSILRASLKKGLSACSVFRLLSIRARFPGALSQLRDQQKSRFNRGKFNSFFSSYVIPLKKTCPLSRTHLSPSCSRPTAPRRGSSWMVAAGAGTKSECPSTAALWRSEGILYLLGAKTPPRKKLVTI